MKQRVPVPLSLRALTTFAAALLLAAGVARADVRYQIRPIVKLGDTVADVKIRTSNGFFNIQGLTDDGKIAFSTTLQNITGAALIQYADGTFLPIAVAGGEGPLGAWPETFAPIEPASMNGVGSLVFAALAGTFRWDAPSGKVTVVAREGMPAGSDLTFESAGLFSPTINNRGEIAFPAIAKNAAGESSGAGIFLARPDGQIVPMVLPGQVLPDGRKVAFADRPNLNDAGVIAFRAYREGDPEDGRNHAYLWDGEKIISLVAAHADAPGGGKFAYVLRARVNNANRNVLILTLINSPDSGRPHLYLWNQASGAITPVAVAGQEMPGGGRFRDVGLGQYGVSDANRLGQHAFIATLSDGSTAAYRMDADGTLSLILKSGTTTELGKITRIGQSTFTGSGLGGYGIGLNSHGQVVLPVRIDGGPDTIVLLTPKAE